jgi:hypothetical protein
MSRTINAEKTRFRQKREEKAAADKRRRPQNRKAAIKDTTSGTDSL